MQQVYYFITTIFIACGICVNGQVNPITARTQYPTPDNQRNLNSSMYFTQNKGQIVDMDGKLRPDVLYKGEDGGADIYLRKTGISYVCSNMGEAVHEVDKQVEELTMTGIITPDNLKKKKQELLQRANIKVQRVDMDFEGANENITSVNEDEVNGYNNYYYAHCPNGVLNVKQYNKVTYKNIYNGIDIVYNGSTANACLPDRQGLKYDLIVQPHADPNQIKLHWKGAESIQINSEGNLVIKTSVNDGSTGLTKQFTESMPKVYQIINGKVVDVKTKYVLTTIADGEAIINFSFLIYNSSFPLIIDPWATYYGGTGDDSGSSVATDAAGDVYMAGTTASIAGIPSVLGFQIIFGGNFADAFLVKFNSIGNRIWATYYGGAGSDYGVGVATDALLNVYITGNTGSTTGIAAGGFQNISTGQNAFLVKFNSAGLRLWGTYYGGGNDYGTSVAIDPSTADVYMAGSTQIAGWITPGGFQNTYGGGAGDAFLVKFNSAGGFLWATYYGGTKYDAAYSVATDAGGNVYMTGMTSSNIGTSIASGGTQNIYGGGLYDAFLVEFNSVGNRLWGTYYGGTDDDRGFSVATDAGNVYLAGCTGSATGIASGGFQNIFGGGVGIYDAFLAKFNSAANLLWGTYYGAAGVYESGCSIATDGSNNVYLLIEPEDAPSLVDACSFNPVFNGGINAGLNPVYGYPEDQLIVKFSSSGQKICATYIGGIGEEEGWMDGKGGIAIFSNSLYVTGKTTGGYPVSIAAFQTIFAGPFLVAGSYNGTDAFLAQLCTNICEGKLLGSSVAASTNNVCPNTLITFTPAIQYSCDISDYTYQWTFTGGTPASSTAVNPTVSFAGVGSHDVQLTVTTICKTETLTLPAYINVVACNTPCLLSAQFTQGTAACSGCGCKEWIMINAMGGTSPYSYTWADGYDKRYKNHLCTGTYTVNIKDKNGCSVNVNLSAP